MKCCNCTKTIPIASRYCVYCGTTQQPPQGVTGVALLAIISGIPLTIAYGIGLLGVVSGIWMFKRKNWARRLAIFYFGLFILISFIAAIGITGEYGSSLDYNDLASNCLYSERDCDMFCSTYYEDEEANRQSCLTGVISERIALAGKYRAEFLFWLPLVAFIFGLSLQTFSYLFRPTVKDFFMFTSIARQATPSSILTILGWLHIILGFWAIIPLLIGIRLLRWQNRDTWQFTFLEVTLICLLCLVLFLVGAGETFDAGTPNIYSRSAPVQATTGILAFAFFLQLWFYLLRRDIRQVFP